MAGEDLGYLLPMIMEQGALDIYYTPIHMKKNRPAVQITTLCKVEDKAKFQEILLKNTSTFGVRTTTMQRAILERNFRELRTKNGILKIKCGYLNGKLVKVTPEFESVRQLAEQKQCNFHSMYNFCIGEAAQYMIKKKGENQNAYS